VKPEEWIAHDPDPDAVAELSACTPDELAARFSGSLTFGTAGLRGPMRAGPTGMNVAVVLRSTWGLARVLKDRRSRAAGDIDRRSRAAGDIDRSSRAAGDIDGRLDGSAVVIGYDARHGSRRFAVAAAEVLAAEGFSVQLMPEPLPTPVLAFAVRQTGAAAGVQITASHNPASDNGYKVYLDGGVQIVSPTDREIETAIASAPYADRIGRIPVAPGSSSEIVEHYLRRAAAVRRGSGPVRVALTPMHGVGGTIAIEALRRAGITDVHTVADQFAPDPDFPTVVFPNPEEPGAADAVLDLAARVDADVAVALDPDADRCAIGVPDDGGWRMLSGDETGWLLGDYILSHPTVEVPVVASSVVSSRMLASIAAAHGARHVETLTGFKWLARAAGDDLVYAYEEAIGHCVDPAAVRDKDGISAAVLCCDVAATAKAAGRDLRALLDGLARGHGVHLPASITERSHDAAAVMTRLRDDPPTRLAGFHVTAASLADVLILTGGNGGTWVRLAVRPSGTEPKIKGYIEIGQPATDDLAAARASAMSLCEAVRRDAAALLQRGPN
jgi:phosphomannomutase